MLMGCEKNEEILSEREVEIKEGIIYKNNKTIPFTGKLILKSPNIEDVFSVKKGKVYGIKYFFYYNSGRVGYLEDFTKNKQDRLYRQYFKNGNLYCERNYKTGSYEEYNNGNLKLKGFYTILGSKTGSWKIYENNQLIIEKNYSEGLLEGSYKNYYENKKLESKGAFKNGKKQGEWIEYRKNGELFSKEFYKNGKLEGSIKEYYENGNIMSEGVYKDGKFPNMKKY